MLKNNGGMITMDFYQRKEKAIRIIDEMIRQGKYKREEISYGVFKSTTLSDQFTYSYIEKGLLMGAILEDKTTGIIIRGA